MVTVPESEPCSGAFFRQAKVEDLGVSPGRDEDVVGLDIAMNDAHGMSGVQCVGNLDSEHHQRFQI
jgi:hypothetical protein